jgi:flagellar biosynthesis/type III secretory pathway protein FliH
MKDYYETEIERLREEAKANKDNDYHQGRSDGEETGYRMGYDDGHKDGLREGYEDGYKDGLREVE